MEVVGGFSELKNLNIPQYLGIVEAMAEREKMQKKELDKNKPKIPKKGRRR